MIGNWTYIFKDNLTFSRTNIFEVPPNITNRVYVTALDWENLKKVLLDHDPF